jgi:hypothetical protein
MRPRIYGDRIDPSVTNQSISITGALAEAEQRVIERLSIEGEVIASETVSDGEE